MEMEGTPGTMASVFLWSPKMAHSHQHVFGAGEVKKDTSPSGVSAPSFGVSEASGSLWRRLRRGLGARVSGGSRASAFGYERCPVLGGKNTPRVSLARGGHGLFGCFRQVWARVGDGSLHSSFLE